MEENCLTLKNEALPHDSILKIVNFIYLFQITKTPNWGLGDNKILKISLNIQN